MSDDGSISRTRGGRARGEDRDRAREPPASIRGKIGLVNEVPDEIDQEIHIEAPEAGFGDEVEARLRAELGSCPDVAFAHLTQVTVVGRQPEPQTSLFVWLVPEAVGSLRPALNLVSEAVARALPEHLYVDVLILNSVPELLAPVEAAGCLLVERDAKERRRALAAADRSRGLDAPKPRRRLWPFRS